MTAELHFDEATRRLYANDASLYEELPAGVAFPRTTTECVELLALARARLQPVTLRAAGTSLAGQATGSGWIIDTSRHLNRIVALDPLRARARVQPGVIRDSLNRAAAPHRLHFAPDTSTTNRCMLGGMIGNNSAGLFSVKYGSTRDHVHELQVALSDGSVATFGPLAPGELGDKQQQDNLEGAIYREMDRLLREHADLIRRSYPHPEIIRRNTGYALDRLLEMEPYTAGGPSFNLAELLCGSEGTLAVTVEAELRLTPLPAHTLLVVPHFPSVIAAAAAATAAVQSHAAAVELMDETVLSAALRNREQQRNRAFIEGDPGALLIIELHGADAAELKATGCELGARLCESHNAYAAPVITDTTDAARVWDLRKAGLGLLMGTWTETKTPEFMEDTAVRVEDLPAYVRDIQTLMERHNTRCVYYGHASVGELHLRPELNPATHEGVEKMKAMAAEVADLVHTYGGSLSGEHGDGRVRAPFIERVLGTEMIPVLERVKQIWDPENLLNPGKIVRPGPMERPFRVAPGEAEVAVDTLFQWRDQSSFQQMLDRCNGAGVCRKLAESGGGMCPSYMATREERDSTRGRANLFRQLFRGRRAEAFASADLKRALDLCLSCKSCKTECPANVDMARMKAEFMNGWHHHHGATRTERFFAFPEKMLRLGGRVPRIANALNATAVARQLRRALVDMHPARAMPALADEPFHRWFARRSRSERDGPPVLILTDYFMNYVQPEIGRAMVTVLEAMGCRVDITPPRSTGRTCISQGFLSEAKAIATQRVHDLAPYVTSGWAIIGQEPSELLTVRDEFLDLVGAENLEAARTTASGAWLFEEYLVAHREQLESVCDAAGQIVHVHGHCHTKALCGEAPVMDALRHAGYQPVSLKTGCCGMAGSFGYETDHYELSMQIGEQTLFPAVRALDADALLCASGFSCRHQIADGTHRHAQHPAELIASCVGKRED